MASRRDEAFIKELRVRLQEWQQVGGRVAMDGDDVVLYDSDGDEEARLDRRRRKMTEELHEAVRHLVSELNGMKPN